MRKMFDGWTLEEAQQELEKVKQTTNNPGCGTMLYRQALAIFIAQKELERKQNELSK